jgi:hypothetical protein
MHSIVKADDEVREQFCTDTNSLMAAKSPHQLTRQEINDRASFQERASRRCWSSQAPHIDSETFMSGPSWPNVPAERTLSVEAVMDVASTILWPEPDQEKVIGIDDAEAARAHEYSLLATLLACSPDATMLGRIAKLRGDETPLGQAHLALALAASSANAQAIEREFFNLFIVMGRGVLLH